MSDARAGGPRSIDLASAERGAVDLALVGADPAFAEPGCGASADAAATLLRLGECAPKWSDRLGARPGERAQEPLGALLARLATESGRKAFLCGFDPAPHAAELRAGLARGAFVLAGALHRALGSAVPNYALPSSYRCNPVAYFDDTAHTDEWQREVYDLARELADANGLQRIVDLGCGSGYKLVHWFPAPAFRTLGVDLPDTVKFLAEKYPERDWIALDLERHDMLTVSADLIIAADLIEHLADPDLLLGFLSRCRAQAIVLSTPDTQTLLARGQRDPGGPPRNPHHVREWNLREFARYVAGSLEVLHQELHPANATQILVCRPAQTGPPERARLQVSGAAAHAPRVSIPAERPYRGRSRTRELEHQLCALPCERVAVLLVADLERELESAASPGGTMAIFAASSGAAQWSPVDGMLGAECSREALLAALAGERGPHGPERALLRLAGAAPDRRVVRVRTELTPAAQLAQLEALFGLQGPDARWPDPRPLLGPALRVAIGRALQLDPALAEDLAGCWSLHSGAPLARRPSLTPPRTNPSAPELAVPIDAGAPWLLIDPERAGAFDAALAHAGSSSKTPLHLILPLAAGTPVDAFAVRLIAELDAAGLDRNTIAPLVVLERPLTAAEIAWVAESFPAWKAAGESLR